MARLFGLLQKKRGQRTTGSRLAGMVGEVMIFGIVLLLGLISLGWLLFNPEPTSDLGMMYVLNISLILIGGGGIMMAVVQYGISAERRKAITLGRPALDVMQDNLPSAHRFPTIPPDADTTDSPGVRLRYRLPQTESHFWPILAATLFFGSWAIVTVTLAAAVGVGFWQSTPNWLFVCLLPGCLIVSSWSGKYFLQQLSGLTRIGPTVLEISQHPLVPGAECDVFLSQSGLLQFKSFKVTLVCEEQTSYHQGTDLRVEAVAVFRDRLIMHQDQTVRPGTALEDEFTLSIPETAMHSFRGQYNRIQWKLVVEGRSLSMPTFTHSFPIIVHPRMKQEGTA